ncbi:hypothetical protein [Microseira wollei]|uniref:Uncharacterized protein n=1 Tax=Microseira wollei NIES-4236 TaxID=2530354 RepID=A0AAV3XEY4_9CYAN|nr:hypothetical protein [Microseira wollei]GET41507.1 hypothetical protein MiSe_63190 [Microseira wollei NIES-4236]
MRHRSEGISRGTASEELCPRHNTYPRRAPTMARHPKNFVPGTLTHAVPLQWHGIRRTLSQGHLPRSCPYNGTASQALCPRNKTYPRRAPTMARHPKNLISGTILTHAVPLQWHGIRSTFSQAQYLPTPCPYNGTASEELDLRHNTYPRRAPTMARHPKNLISGTILTHAVPLQWHGIRRT